jgi:hypothetical protein
MPFSASRRQNTPAPPTWMSRESFVRLPLRQSRLSTVDTTSPATSAIASTPGAPESCRSSTTAEAPLMAPGRCRTSSRMRLCGSRSFATSCVISRGSSRRAGTRSSSSDGLRQDPPQGGHGADNPPRVMEGRPCGAAPPP